MVKLLLAFVMAGILLLCVILEGGDKQTLNLAPGSVSQMYTAPKQFSHPPSFWFQ
jgi:hypothetical protein